MPDLVSWLLWKKRGAKLRIEDLSVECPGIGAPEFFDFSRSPDIKLAPLVTPTAYEVVTGLLVLGQRHL